MKYNVRFNNINGCMKVCKDKNSTRKLVYTVSSESISRGKIQKFITKQKKLHNEGYDRKLNKYINKINKKYEKKIENKEDNEDNEDIKDIKGIKKTSKNNMDR
jgi:hypothetical protein